jgi:hypothetical protein
MYKNKYFTENDEIDVSEMLNAVPARMSIAEKTDWLEAFDCLDEETQDELVGVRNIMTERRHTPVADDAVEEDDSETIMSASDEEVEAYFAQKAAEFDRKKSMRR